MVTSDHTVVTQLVVSAAETHILHQIVSNQKILLPNAPHVQATTQPTTEDAMFTKNSNVEISLTIKVTFYMIMLILSQLIIITL